MAARKHSAGGLIPLLLCETRRFYFGDMLSFGGSPRYELALA
jgi:hypothetical protein